MATWSEVSVTRGLALLPFCQAIIASQSSVRIEGGANTFSGKNGDMNVKPESHRPKITPTTFTARDPDNEAVAIQIPPKM